MAKIHIGLRIDEETKKKFNRICKYKGIAKLRTYEKIAEDFVEAEYDKISDDYKEGGKYDTEGK